MDQASLGLAEDGVRQHKEVSREASNLRLAAAWQVRLDTPSQRPEASLHLLQTERASKRTIPTMIVSRRSNGLAAAIRKAWGNAAKIVFAQDRTGDLSRVRRMS